MKNSMKSLIIAATMLLGFGMNTVCKADPVGGPKYNHSSVKAYSSDTYNVTLRANESTIISLRGDHDTDLDLYVYDERGRMVDLDNDYSDNCVCEVVPRWTGRFTIKIVNRGAVYNRYTLDVY